MPELVRLKGERQLHNIFEEIGTRYGDFGTLLLEDSTGALIQDLERWCGNDSIRINQEILSGWLQGEGKKPVTWATLIGVLRDINMDPLADDIEDTFGDNATPAGNFIYICNVLLIDMQWSVNWVLLMVIEIEFMTGPIK